MKINIAKYIKWIIMFFLIGLLFQFFLQTLVTYKLEREGTIRKIIRLWKEILILILALVSVSFLSLNIYQQGWRVFYNKWKGTSFFRFILYFVILVVISIILALGVQKVGFGAYIISVKYDLLGFFIFILGVMLMQYIPEIKINYERHYGKVLKFVAWGGLFRWGMLTLIPGLLSKFGYSREIFEGTLDARPPAVYYSQINHGIVRNQFLFERPISFGFFLVAFRPWFALSYLRKRSRKDQFLWTCAFGLLVFSTLSRGAIGVWILQTGLIFCMLYRKVLKKFIWYALIPAIFILCCFFRTYKGIFVREHSNTGHKVLLQEGIKIALMSPFKGWGAGYSGPASHQLCFNNRENPRCKTIYEINQKYEILTPGYNPENQYVQIFMEYGFFGVAMRLCCFIRLLRHSLKLIFVLYKEEKKGKKADKKKCSLLYSIIGFGIGLGGLAVEGLVLHSFVDRMIVYPFMLLFGLYYGIYLLEQEQEKEINLPGKK